jgi:transposase
MNAGVEVLPDDIEALKAALIVAHAEAAAARAQRSDDQALIAHLKLQIEKLNRDRCGPRSERATRLLDQIELTLEELETAATEDELAAEMAAARTTNATTTAASFTRKRLSRKPFADHLPRERVIVPGPVACSCCGGARLSRLGEDITETLEVIPKSWKVIQHVREKFSCRDCEKISLAPAPFHAIARGWAGPSLLAMVLFEKFGQHQPLNRQAERYAKEGVPISLSTLADQVGGCTAALMPLFRRLEAFVLSAERLHGDDTTVPVLGKVKTDTGRIWGATTSLLVDRRHWGPCSITHETAPASIPRRIWPTTAASSRPTPTAAMDRARLLPESDRPRLHRPIQPINGRLPYIWVRPVEDL